MKSNNKKENKKILEEFEEFKGKGNLYGYPKNRRSNEYVTLAEGFELYSWILKMIKNKNSIKKSRVLSFLYEKEFDFDYNRFKRFVFNPFKNKKTQDKISQKWHYYIAYYLMKEYWGIIDRKDGIADFKNALCKDMSKKPWVKELRDWYNLKGKKK